MNRSASSIISLDEPYSRHFLTQGVTGSSINIPTPTPIVENLPTRVYRIVLTRGTQEVTCTNVATDEGFVKFYNYIRSTNGINTCSVVAMYPAGNIQQITSVLEETLVLV